MRTNELTPLSLAVLELLHERPMHPYEIHQTIRDRYTDHVVKVRAGSLYHTVEGLHRRELIEPVEIGSPSAGYRGCWSSRSNTRVRSAWRNWPGCRS